jgi:hypothetical protein
MKKLLAITILIFSLIACDNTSPEGNNPNGKSRANDTEQFNNNRVRVVPNENNKNGGDQNNNNHNGSNRDGNNQSDTLRRSSTSSNSLDNTNTQKINIAFV